LLSSLSFALILAIRWCNGWIGLIFVFTQF
jgi:hypothetical protein